MIARLRFLGLFAAACLLPLSAFGQTMGGTDPMGASLPGNLLGNINPYNDLLQKHWLVAGKVVTLHGVPVAGAKVEVTPIAAAGEFRTLQTNFQGEFQTEYQLNADFAKEFSVDLKVTKKGFLRAHALIDFGSSTKTWLIPVTLREPEAQDSGLLSQPDLMSALAPRLRKLKVSDGLSAASEKDYARGVEEFVEAGRPERALVPFAKVTRRDASCLLCRTTLALAELDSGDWDGAYHNLAEVFNKMQANRSLGRPEPYLALGVMESWRNQPRNAAGYFLEALKFAPQDALALQELGRSQLLMENWGPADDYLAKAIVAGAKPEARLLRVEALLGGNQSQAAAAEMAQYLNGRDVKKMPIQVRKLWAEVENHKKIEATYAKEKPKGDRELDYIHHPPSDLPGLVPATDQKQLESILSEVGKTVEEFFDNFPNTSSLEEIHQEKTRRKQKTATTLDQKFRYLCFTPAESFGPGFEEYRSDLLGRLAFPQGLGDGFMLTSGFASAALVFHPLYQRQADFRYLGRQKLNGRDIDVIAFAQQPAKARLNGTFKSGSLSLTTFSQGLAWVDSQSHQIVRLRCDLLKPLFEVNLERQTTEISYSEVHFNGISAGFWVPQQVVVAVDWNGKHLRNEHRYSEFKVFNVEAIEKRGKPKELSQTPD